MERRATALEWIAKHYGVSVEETVCVGDWMNDLPMLGAAGRSFAMGQAPDEVKKAATDVLERTITTGARHRRSDRARLRPLKARVNGPRLASVKLRRDRRAMGGFADIDFQYLWPMMRR